MDHEPTSSTSPIAMWIWKNDENCLCLYDLFCRWFRIREFLWKCRHFATPKNNETCFQDGLDAIFIYIFSVNFRVYHFSIFFELQTNRANLRISHQNMFFPWLIVLSLFGSLFFRRFFPGRFPFLHGQQRRRSSQGWRVPRIRRRIEW